MPKATSKQRSDEIVKMLQRAPQTVAAWFIGVTPRALRDNVSCPRNSDGSYDLKEVAEWSHRRRELADLTDEEVEKVYTISDLLHQASGDMRDSIVQVIIDLQGKYGKKAAETFAQAFMDRWCWVVDAFPDDWRPATSEELREQQRRHEESKRKDAEYEQAVDELRVSSVCEKCGKLRRGRRWLDEAPPPDHVVVRDGCPTCSPTM